MLKLTRRGSGAMGFVSVAPLFDEQRRALSWVSGVA